MAGTRYKTQSRDWHGRWKAERGGARKGTRKITRKLADVRDRVGGAAAGSDGEEKPGLLRRIGRAIKRVAKKVVSKLRGEDLEFFLANGAFFTEDGDLMVPEDVLGEWESREGIMLRENETVIEDLDELEAAGVHVVWEGEPDEDSLVEEDLDDLLAAGVTVCVEDEDGELLELDEDDVKAVYDLLD